MHRKGALIFHSTSRENLQGKKNNGFVFVTLPAYIYIFECERVKSSNYCMVTEALGNYMKGSQAFMTLPQLQNQGSGHLGPFCQLIYEKTLNYIKL
jgi:hypothetical protein